MLPYEKYLLDELFKGRSLKQKNEVKVSELKLTFYEELQEVKKKLYEDVVDKKLFPKDPEKVRQNYLAFGVVLVVLGFIGATSAGGSEFIILFDLCIGVVVSGLILVILSRFMPRRTAYGRELYRRVKGYELFLNTAEKYRQQFFEKKNLFNEVLPYVIIFGLTEKFAKAMADIGLKPTQTTWYRGTGAFNTVLFGNSMSAFSSSVGSAIAAAPKSSGFSGGGSSGGGFGGGGGGSW